MDGSQKWKILRLHVEDGIPLASLARETGVGERTLSRWHSLYRTVAFRLLSGRSAPMPACGGPRLSWWLSWSTWL